MKVGDLLVLSPHALAKEGEGVARAGNFVIFIPYAVPGDKVEVEIQKVGEQYARGTIKTILEPSEDRIQPLCPIFGKCGGCQLQHIQYEAQLRYKEDFLRNFVTHHGKFSPEFIQPIIPAVNPWHYRNKIQLAAGPNNRLGLFSAKTHDVVDMAECMIQSNTGNEVLTILRRAIQNSAITNYNEKTGEGILRHILIKVGEQGKSALVVLVVTKSSFPGESILLDTLSQCHPLIKGVAVNINNKKGNRILGDANILKWGEGFIEESIGGLFFRIGAASFFQVNTEQISRFYTILDNWLPEQQDKFAFDAYAGVGTFSLWLARKFKQVTHVEIYDEAVKLAAINAKRNNIFNITFVSEAVEKALPQLKIKSWDTGLLDPPRSGLSPEVLHNINQFNITNLIYISCNPATLIRDLNQLVAYYEILEIQPLDLFPHTGHMEVMVKMTAKK